MNSDVEEDFPLNGSAKLAKLFEDNLVENISFRYKGPKPPPPRSVGSSKGLPHDHIPLSVVIGKTVEAFQLGLHRKAEGYATEGKVGMVVIGNDEFSYYQLYMYRSDERKVTSVDVTFNFKFQVQDHNYASFKDNYGIQWSIHFDKAEDLISFTKEVTLARWKSSKSSQTKLVQDAFKGNSEFVVKKTDTVQALCTVHGLSSDNKMEKDYINRVISASASSNVWITSVIGACLNSRRFIIVPSNYLEGMDLSVPVGNYIFMEMEIHQITASSETPGPKSPLPSQHDSKSTSTEKEEVESLSGRIARLGYALPSLQMFDSEAPDRLRMSREALHSRTASSVPSAVSLYSAKEERAVASPTSDPGFDISTSSQFNVLFSEVRTSNSEIRMNISRVTDKVDALLSKLDFAPHINQKIVPYMEKVQMMDEVLNKLVEQNNSMISVLEQSSPKNFGMTINEMVHLKKRNGELESFFQVLTSTNQILKEKVQELSVKVKKLETETNNGNGNKLCQQCEEAIDLKVKGLVDCVKVLEEKNNVLERANGELEKQNTLLSDHRLTLIQDRGDQEERFSKEILEKSKKIEMLEKQLEMLRLKVKKAICKHGLEKEITDAAKGLMNKTYKSLKTHFKEMSKDQPLFDHDLADILREVTREYLDHYFNVEKKLSPLFQESSNEASASSLQGEEHSSGNLPFLPSDVPLPPLPKPRRHRSLTPSPGVDVGDISQIPTAAPLESQSQVQRTITPSERNLWNYLSPNKNVFLDDKNIFFSAKSSVSDVKPSEKLLPVFSQFFCENTLPNSEIKTDNPVLDDVTIGGSENKKNIFFSVNSPVSDAKPDEKMFPFFSQFFCENTLTNSEIKTDNPVLDDDTTAESENNKKNIFFRVDSPVSDAKPDEKLLPVFSQSFCENTLPNSGIKTDNPVLDDVTTRVLENDQNLIESLTSSPCSNSDVPCNETKPETDEIPIKLSSESNPVESVANLSDHSTVVNEDNASLSTSINEKVRDLKSKNLDENKNLKTVEPSSSLFETVDNVDLFSQSFTIPYSAPFIPTTPPPIEEDEEVAAMFRKWRIKSSSSEDSDEVRIMTNIQDSRSSEDELY